MSAAVPMVSPVRSISAAVRLDDQHRASLTLVSSFWADEGSCILEIAEGQRSDLVEYGTWRLSHDAGPVTVSLELPDSTDVEPETLEALLTALVHGQGSEWGIEAAS